jgi:ribosomal protein S27E
MLDDQEYPQEEPLDFSQPQHLCRCPYCGETLGSDELETYLAPESNTFICPNCRKKLNIYDLGSNI